MAELSNVQISDQISNPARINKLVENKQSQLKGQGIEVYDQRGKDLGKDKFLQLLITQLTHQDPLKPMDDTQFIAQMAQFSALEQMTEVNKNIVALSQQNRSLASFSLLGRYVEGKDEASGKLIRGLVKEIKPDENKTFLIMENGQIEMNNLKKVLNQK